MRENLVTGMGLVRMGMELVTGWGMWMGLMTRMRLSLATEMGVEMQ